MESDLWRDKIHEILSFKGKGLKEEISGEQKLKLIEIYNKYRSVFSDAPGKPKDFTCELKFHESVQFNRKSYPIAQSLKMREFQ